LENILGVIAEYNPFHNGHLYHLQESKKITNSKYSVAVISSNFTQRGDTSFLSKWDKCKMLLDNGIDLVLELPTIYSVSSAENFAYGGISILNSLNVITHLSFGSESGNINMLSAISKITKTKRFQKLLKENLDEKVSYPKAMSEALKQYSSDYSEKDIFTSNNILAIEYLSSLRNLKSDIIPVTIKRDANNYNDFELSTSSITSASSIRNALNNNGFNLEEIKKYIPLKTFNILKTYTKHIALKDFEREIIYSLKKSSISDISNLPEVSEGLEYKIKKAASMSHTLEDLIDNVKSKRYTLPRIQRILVYSLLGITKKDMEFSKNIIPYVRVLGFNENGKKILSKIKRENKDLNIITSLKKLEDDCTNSSLLRLLEIDKLATDVFNIEYLKSKKSIEEKIPNDYNQKIITI